MSSRPTGESVSEKRANWELNLEPQSSSKHTYSEQHTYAGR